jgi:hypothetical protein
MHTDWLPQPATIQKLESFNGIPADYAVRQIPEFVTYWLDNGKAYPSWDAKFLSSVNRTWTRQQQYSTPPETTHGKEPQRPAGRYRSAAYAGPGSPTDSMHRNASAPPPGYTAPGDDEIF